MINQDLLRNRLTKIEHLSFKCQSCNIGTKILEKNKYFEAESGFSRNEFKQRINGFHTKINRRFSAALVCSNPDCLDISIVTGDSDSLLRFKTIEFEGQITDAPIYDNKIIIHDIIPTLHLFDLNKFTFKNSNSNIAKELEDAFSVFWRNSDCCGMKIRSFLEALMDDSDIPKKTTNKEKEIEIKLHRRIELFAKQFINHDLEDILLNLKLSGNLGSHSGQNLERDDLILMIEIVELILSRLYTDDKKKLQSLNEELSKKLQPN